MTKIYSAIGIALALVLLGTGLVGIYYLVVWVGSLFMTLDPPLRALTGILAASLLISALIVSGACGRSRGRIAVERKIKERAVLYGEVAEFWAEQLQQTSADSGTRQDVSVRARALDARVVLWGGTRVIKAHHVLMGSLFEGRTSQDAESRALCSLIAEMRRELHPEAPKTPKISIYGAGSIPGEAREG